jgi:hypothetical protein
VTRDHSKAWDAGDDMRELIVRTPELDRLFGRLGYSARLDIDTDKTIAHLKSLLQLDVNFSSFQREVDNVQAEIDKVERGDVSIPAEISEPEARKLWMDLAHPLHDVLDGGKWKANCWKAALIARKDKKKLGGVLTLLKQAFEDEWWGYMVSAHDRVPFRDLGFAKWNVSQPAEFLKLLQNFESDIESAEAILGQSTSRQLCEHAAQVKRSVQSMDADIWRSLLSLKRARDSAISPRQDCPTGANLKELDSLLWDLVYMKHEHDPLKSPNDARFFGDAVLEQTEKYLARDWMHTPWLTNRLVGDLLDSVIGAVAAEIGAADSGRITAGLPWPWGVLVPKLVSFLFFVGSVIGIALAFAADLPWLGWAGIGYVAWHYFWRFRRNYLVSKIRGELAAWASRLEWIRDEVTRGKYDPVEIANRLRKPEEKRFVIPSLVFPLLKLAPCQEATSAPSRS